MKTIKSISYALFSLSLLALGMAQAGEMASSSYRISWDVIDGGGGMMTSASYVLVDSVGQPSPIGASASTNYALQAGFHAPPDDDGDLVRSFMDNCIFDPNTDQRDTNGDGFGNICDPDLDNSGFVNTADLAILKAAFFSNSASGHWNPDADLTGDGFVNFNDLFLMRILYFMAPGPSGIAP